MVCASSKTLEQSQKQGRVDHKYFIQNMAKESGKERGRSEKRKAERKKESRQRGSERKVTASWATPEGNLAHGQRVRKSTVLLLYSEARWQSWWLHTYLQFTKPLKGRRKFVADLRDATETCETSFEVQGLRISSASFQILVVHTN